MRWNLRVPDVQLSWFDLTIGHRHDNHSEGGEGDLLFLYNYNNQN